MTTTSPSQFKSAGWLLLVMAAAIALMVTLQPERLRAPAWVAYAGGLAFALGGLTSLARGYGRDLLADGIVCLLLAAMMAIVLWIAFGPGARQCMGRVALLGMRASEWSCRTAFGIGALVLVGMLLLAVRGLVRRKSGA